MTQTAPPQNLGRTASKSVFWNMIGSVAISAIRFASTAILARLLMPEDFGIIGMAFVVTQLVQLFGNLGLGAALIQKERVDEGDLSTAYWSSLAAGAVLMLAGFASSPLAAIFFQRDVVQPVVICLSTTFFLGAFSSVQYMLLSRELRYKEIAVVEIIATVLRVVVALTLAWQGLSFWSIIIAIIVERVAKSVIFYFHSHWRPKRMFVWSKFHDLFAFGRSVYGSGFLIYFNNNMDYIIIGRLLGAAQLGYYQFAFNIPHLVQTHFAAKIHQVLFPVYSKIQSQNDRIARGVYKTLDLTSLVTFPLMAGLMIAAPEFILTVYGDKWAPAILPLRILCVAAAMKSLMMANAAVLLAKGRPDISFKWGLMLMPVTLLLIIYGSRWGTIGVAMAMTTLSLFGLILTHISFRFIDQNLTLFFRSIRKASLNSGLLAVVLILLNRMPVIESLAHWQRLLLDIAVGATVYAVALHFLFKEGFDLLIEIYRHLAQKKSTV